MDYLKPTGKLIEGKASGRPALIEIPLSAGNTNDGLIVRGSVLPATE